MLMNLDYVGYNFLSLYLLIDIDIEQDFLTLINI